MAKAEPKRIELPALEWVHVGPEWATRALESMPHNRQVSGRWVAILADRMRRGQWEPDLADPVRLNTKGELLDGQHRLWAIIETGVTLPVLIVRGLASESIMAMDSGRRRTLKDQLHLMGEKTPEILASAIAYYDLYNRTGELASSAWGVLPLTVQDAMLVLEANPGLRHSCEVGYGVARAVGGGRGRWGAIHYIFSEIDEEDADEFMRRMKDGDGIPQGSPLGLLRKRLIDSWVKPGAALSVRDFGALVFKAWNLWRKGERVLNLSWRPGGSHPERYPVPS